MSLQSHIFVKNGNSLEEEEDNESVASDDLVWGVVVVDDVSVDDFCFLCLINVPTYECKNS
jgi:septin family protein